MRNTATEKIMGLRRVRVLLIGLLLSALFISVFNAEEQKTVLTDSTDSTSSGSIRVTKSLRYDGNTIYFSDLSAYYKSLNVTKKDTVSFYAALFSDRKKTNRVSNVRKITFKEGMPTASTTFSNLNAGIYYVGEVDKNGNLIGTEKDKEDAADPFFVTYDKDKVKISGSTSKTSEVKMMNNYFDKPEGINYYAYVTVRKIYKNKDGQEKNSNKKFYFLLRRWVGNECSWIGSTSSPHVLKMKGKSRAEVSLPISMSSSKTSKISAVEVELDGNGEVQRTADGAIKAVSTWNVSYSNPSVKVSRNQATVPVITITNQEKGIVETGRSGNNSVALTLTKKVTYKGKPQAVNGVYYIGIFKSPDLSKKNLVTSVKPIALRNASQASRDPMTVNLASPAVKNGQITLYFAETDKDGNPLKSGSSTGYNISINGQKGNSYSVTFTADTPAVKVTVINDIIAGGETQTITLHLPDGFTGNIIRSDSNGYTAWGDTGSENNGDIDTEKKPATAASRIQQKGADGTALGKGASVEAAEKYLKSYKAETDPKGSSFNLLQLKAGKAKNNQLTLSWKKVSGAAKYVVYGNQCGVQNKYMKQAVVKKTSVVIRKVNKKKLKKGTYYKFILLALDKNNNVISTSKTVHAATTGGKVGNSGKVTTKAKKNKVSIKAKETFRLAGRQLPASKERKVKIHRKVKYESTNPKIASVSAKGVITGKKKGTCFVYAYAQNGVSRKIKVTVN